MIAPAFVDGFLFGAGVWCGVCAVSFSIHFFVWLVHRVLDVVGVPR